MFRLNGAKKCLMFRAILEMEIVVSSARSQSKAVFLGRHPRLNGVHFSQREVKASAKLNIRTSPRSADQKVHPPPPPKDCPEIRPRDLSPPSPAFQHRTNNAKVFDLVNPTRSVATTSFEEGSQEQYPIFPYYLSSSWHFVPRAPIQGQDGCVPQAHIQLHYLPRPSTTTGQRAPPLSPLFLHSPLHSLS